MLPKLDYLLYHCLIPGVTFFTLSSFKNDEINLAWNSKALYYSREKYMNSDQFDPKNTLSFELIQDVFTTPSKETFDTYTKDSPDELKPNSNQNKVK